ncbi:MAG TPA: YlbF family regulator [Anaerolineales bacterium]|nr:YlbF family regulator [Anaerolineales bacterium]
MQTFLSPALQEATHSLIDNLLASEPFIHFQQAHDRFNADREARTLLEQLNQSQARVRQMQSKGGVNQAEVDSLRLLQQRVQGNPVIMEYAQSQQEAVSFLREINNEISELLGVNFATFANHATC